LSMSWYLGERKKTRSQVQRETLEANRRNGKNAEDLVRLKYELQGWQIEKTNRGPDFNMKRRNYFTGTTEYKRVEVKSGNAQLSDYQQKVKRKSRFTVEHVDNNGFGFW